MKTIVMMVAFLANTELAEPAKLDLPDSSVAQVQLDENTSCQLRIEPDGVYLSFGSQKQATKFPRGLLVLRSQKLQKSLRLHLISGKEKDDLVAAYDMTTFDGSELRLECFLQGPDQEIQRFARRQNLSLSADRVAVFKQKICPVTKAALTSMGKPVKAKVAGIEVFVCCAPCIKTIEEDPVKYLAVVGKKAAAVQDTTVQWVRSTSTDQSDIKRQAICPVMEHKLGSMGAPWKRVIDGKPVFVCCKGCKSRVDKKPKDYLAKAFPKTADKD